MHVVSIVAELVACVLTFSAQSEIAARWEYPPKAIATKMAAETTFPTMEEITFIMMMATRSDTPDKPRATFFRVSTSVAAKIVLIEQP